MSVSNSRRPKAIEFPPGTIELGELVSAVRDILRTGLPDGFQRSCVRIGGFTPFGGGWKAQLVGGLRIDVHSVLKLGNEELEEHVVLMDYLNTRRPGTFPRTLHVTRAGPGRVFLLMENLRGYVTLLTKVYAEGTRERELASILGQVFEALRAIHAITDGTDTPLARLSRTPEPFVARLVGRLDDVFRADPDLAVVMEQAGRVMGRACLPVKTLLAQAAQLAGAASSAVRPRLVHGDAHLGNLLARRAGKTSYRVRLIDPNPKIGFSQPLYDIGKLLHWAEPVGWTQIRPQVCRVSWRTARKGRAWQLDAHCEGVSAAAEKRRSSVAARIRHFAEEYRVAYGDSFEPMLAVATASAHVGLAALLRNDADRTARRFVFAHALHHLASLGEERRTGRPERAPA